MTINHHITKALASERVADLRRKSAGRGEREIKPKRSRRPRPAPKRRQAFDPGPAEDL